MINFVHRETAFTFECKVVLLEIRLRRFLKSVIFRSKAWTLTENTDTQYIYKL
jgi:hypothetical protein